MVGVSTVGHLYMKYTNEDMYIVRKQKRRQHAAKGMPSNDASPRKLSRSAQKFEGAWANSSFVPSYENCTPYFQSHPMPNPIPNVFGETDEGPPSSQPTTVRLRTAQNSVAEWTNRLFQKMHQPRQPTTAAASIPDVSSETEVVFVDGACRHNGKPEAIAGIGVWFKQGDPRNVAAPLEGAHQTNQRSELKAAAVGAKICADAAVVKNVLMRSDSKYAVDGINIWIKKWKRNGWITAKGEAVLNKDLWMQFDEAVTKLQLLGKTFRIEHVKAHAGIPGNEAADRLANLGIEKALCGNNQFDLE